MRDSALAVELFVRNGESGHRATLSVQRLLHRRINQWEVVGMRIALLGGDSPVPQMNELPCD